MSSLRARIIALTALVAALSTAVCAVAASRAVAAGTAAQERAHAERACDAVRARFAELGAALDREAADCARDDELWARMPSPPFAWARQRLVPGRRGGVARAFALVVDGAVVLRCRPGGVGDDRAAAGDAANPRAIAALAAAAPGSGAAALGGAPALWAARPITSGDGVAPARGVLVALAYLDGEALARIAPPSWTLALALTPGPPDALPIAIDAAGDATLALPARDGALRACLVGDHHAARLLALQSDSAIFGAGVAAAATSIAVGLWLGWRWLRPVHLLAEACRARALDPRHPLPALAGLPEADVLATSLRALVDAERAGRDELSVALTREATANAVHERFLAQLGHELGGPIRVLIGAIERIDANGRLEPERLAAARATALTLEERFQEVLGVASEIAGSDASATTSLRADEYLVELAELLAPLARRRHARLVVDAPAENLPIDRRLLTPILVNLASNALKASDGGEVALRLRREGREAAWSVEDAGAGIPADLAQRIASAFARGEVLPGEEGIGLGLALALANARALGGRLRLVGSAPGRTSVELRVPAATSTASWRRR